MSRHAVVLLLLAPILLCSQTAKQDEIKPYEDSEAYNVYSAVLSLEKSAGTVLIGDTTVPFSECLDSRSDELVDAAIKDYKKINQNQWRLAHHFAAKQPYKLLSADEGSALLERDKRTGDWPLSPYNGIHRVSAVGFSADKTIAFVEMDVACGGLCGYGSPFILQKKKGRWIQYSPPATENPDGTISIPGSMVCGWSY